MPTLAELQDFLRKEFPQTDVTIESVDAVETVVRKTINTADLRPGGTVSGPVMMAVADVAVYVALLADIGLVPLAVTTNLSINFLRKPSADSDIIGRCRLLKSGRTLIIGEVSIYSDGMADPVAHAVATYSVPPKRD
jgi:uncharacterized protein (TIGR00369 family)